MRYRRCVLGAIVVLLCAGVAPAWSYPSPFTFGPSGLSGGGTVNALDLAPRGSKCATTASGTDRTGVSTRPLLAGGDVYGAARSSNGGESWVPADYGITSKQQAGVAAVAFSSSPTLGEAFLWTGGASGPTLAANLLVSSTCGLPTLAAPWQTVAVTAGTTPVLQANGDRPRGVGHLLVVLSDTVVLAGAENGLFIFSRTTTSTAWCQNGALCQQLLVLAGKSIRGIAVDPIAPTAGSAQAVLFVSYGPDPAVAVANSGVSKLAWDGTGTAAGFTVSGTAKLTGSHNYDVVAVKQNDGTGGFLTGVYVAQGNDVAACSSTTSSSNSTWTCSTASFAGALPNAANGALWTTLAGLPDFTVAAPVPPAAPPADNVILFVGCSTVDDSTGQVATCPSSSVYSRTSGTSWQPAVASSNVDTTLVTSHAAGSPDWWLSPENGYMMGGMGYAVGQLQIDTDPIAGTTPTRWLFSAGRAGVWRVPLTSSGAGGTLNVGTWQPAVNGIPGSGVRDISGTSAHSVAIGDGDFTGAVSTKDVAAISPAPTEVGTALTNFTGTVWSTASFQDGTTDRLFYGAGSKGFGGKGDNNLTDVVECDITVPTTGSTCSVTDWGTPLDHAAFTGERRIIGLAAGRTPTGNAYIIFAATENDGLYLKKIPDVGSPSAWIRLTDPNNTTLSVNDPGETAATAGQQANNKISMVWSTGSKFLFVFDPNSSVVYRSPDLSSTIPLSGPWTWDRIWIPQGPPTSQIVTNQKGTDYMVGDMATNAAPNNQPANPPALWVSTESGVFKLTNHLIVVSPAQATVTGPLKATISGNPVVKGTGPIALDRTGPSENDRIVVARSVDANTQSGSTLDAPSVWTNGDTGGTQLTEVSGNIGFLNQALFLDAAAAVNTPATQTPNEFIYFGNHNGGGIMSSPLPAQ